MEVLYERCCGLDIHKRRWWPAWSCRDRAAQPTKEVRSFGTMTDELLQLADWLAASG